MASPPIRMSRPRPMNVLQELRSTAEMATVIRSSDFIGVFDYSKLADLQADIVNFA